MAEPLAIVPDVEARWRRLSKDEQEVAETLLRDASAIARSLVPGLDFKVLAEQVPGDLVAGIVANAVIRFMRNPEGVRSESIDDYSITRDQAVSSGALNFTDTELLMMGGRASTGAVVGWLA